MPYENMWSICLPILHKWINLNDEWQGEPLLFKVKNYDVSPRYKKKRLLYPISATCYLLRCDEGPPAAFLLLTAQQHYRVLPYIIMFALWTIFLATSFVLSFCSNYFSFLLTHPFMESFTNAALFRIHYW